MRLTVDGKPIELMPGMTVRHALYACYGTADDDMRVTDQWGNQVGLEGAAEVGMQLHNKRQPRLSDPGD
ncbi:MAG: hypothetical protein PHN92_15115 [Geobacter sp.]|nr:hypothetical protein [Geobacter sp.]